MQVKRRKQKNKRRSSKKKKSSVLEVRARSKDARKKRLSRFVSLAIPLLAVVALVWALAVGGRYFIRKLFTANERYAISAFDIETDGRLSPGLIKRYGRVEEGVNLFAIDIDQVRQGLENVPIIKKAEVVRKLPGTLQIRITERVALARISDRSRRYQMTVDREGYLLTPARGINSLPSLTGLRLAELKPGKLLDGNLFQDALKVLDLCDRTRLNQFIEIENIDISDTETMELKLKTGEYALLPRRDIRSKLIDLANILNRCRREGRLLAKIDLTVDNVAPAIEYR